MGTRQIITGRNTATKQGHVLERQGSRVNLDDASRVKDGVLAESGGVQEVVNDLAVFGAGEPRLAVAEHDLLEGVDSIVAAEVGLVRSAAAAFPTLPVEYWHHLVSFLQVRHSFTHAFYDSAITNQPPC